MKEPYLKDHELPVIPFIDPKEIESSESKKIDYWHYIQLTILILFIITLPAIIFSTLFISLFTK